LLKNLFNIFFRWVFQERWTLPGLRENRAQGFSGVSGSGRSPYVEKEARSKSNGKGRSHTLGQSRRNQTLN